MKEYKEAQVVKVILSKVICDRCGKECTNTYFDIGSKPSFCDKHDLVETICYDCYERQYKDVVIENQYPLFKLKMKDALEKEGEPQC